jgi:hypothetical protein
MTSTRRLDHARSQAVLDGPPVGAKSASVAPRHRGGVGGNAGLSVRHELERNTIHAIPQAGWLRAVTEDMSKMASAAAAMDLGGTEEKKLNIELTSFFAGATSPPLVNRFACCCACNVVQGATP